MLSKFLISALLVLQTGFVAAEDTSGRKLAFGVNARGLLVRQTSTCPLGSFMCDDGTGCCDIGTTCGFRLSDNYPICKGGSCNGGPICSSGLCCDLGYECNEIKKLCQKTTDSTGSNGSTGSTVSSDSPILDSTPVPTRSSTKSTRTPTKSTTPVSSPTLVDDSETEDPSTSTDEVESITRSIPTNRVTLAPAPTTVLNILPAGTGTPPFGNGAEAHSANSVMKVIVGAAAGVLAFVF